MRIGIAADHGGFELKEQIRSLLHEAGHEITDFGAKSFMPEDDFPDFVVPLARAISTGAVDRGVAICGSGVGANIAANKITNVRAALITDTFSAHQGVEDDDMNLICLGGRITGSSLARELVQTFLSANYTRAERFERRLNKIKQLESR